MQELEHARNQASFEYLPSDILLYLFTLLDAISVAQLGRACKRLYRIGSHEPSWKHLFERRYGIAATKELDTQLQTDRSIGKWRKMYLLGTGGSAYFPASHYSLKYTSEQALFAAGTANLVRYGQFHIANFLRVVIVGASNVGRTWLINGFRYQRQITADEYDAHETDFTRLASDLTEHPILFDLLDTAGDEEYKVLQEQWYRDGNAFLVCFSVTSQSSLTIAGEKISAIRTTRNQARAPIVLVGCKIDLVHLREVSRQQAMEMADKFDTPYIETSSRLHTNVERAFELAAREEGASKLISKEPLQTKNEKCLMM